MKPTVPSIRGSAASTLAPPKPTAPLLSERERDKIEFYATYDVMTGIRIAATLGGFFGLMIVLIVCKSKSKTQKALNDPHLAAVAAEAVAEEEADMEEEELALQAALEATAAWTTAARAARASRRSLGNVSAPGWFARTSPRFSSVGGGYGALLAPPTRPHGHRRSLPGSALRFPRDHIVAPGVGNMVSEDGDTFDEFVDDLHYLAVHRRAASRRCSNITCSSSESSYLERRGSAITSLPPPPLLPSANRRRSSADKCSWEFYYPIDIQVIQPTPDASPCGSERTLYNDPGGPVGVVGLAVPQRLAPLATISSCTSSALDCSHEIEAHTFGSDSVFVDEGPDTDDEITQFSTDSEIDEEDEEYEEEDENDDSCTLEEVEEDETNNITKEEHAWRRRASAPPVRRKEETKTTEPKPMKISKSFHLLNCNSLLVPGSSFYSNVTTVTAPRLNASNDASEKTLTSQVPSVIQLSERDAACRSAGRTVSLNNIEMAARSQETLF